MLISAHSKAAQLAICLVTSGFLLTAGASVSPAGDVKAGRAKALMCQVTPDAPNIAGQTEPYLVTQLLAFKSGTRKNDAMSVIVPSNRDHRR